jgi:hypothetical protein
MDSRTLQLAAGDHDLETMKMLLEPGAGINENLTDWQTDVRECLVAPLSTLYMVVFAKPDEMICCLVEHGVRLPHEDITDPHNSLPKGYRVFMNTMTKLN